MANNNTPLIQVKNLKKSFGDVEVLKGVSFTLERGQILSVIGSSGGGKTTLLRCLNFLERADEGEIIVNGKSVYLAKRGSKPQVSLEAQLSFGLVFQQFNLFPQNTVMENLLLAAKLKEKKEKRSKSKKKCAEILAKANKLCSYDTTKKPGAYDYAKAIDGAPVPSDINSRAKDILASIGLSEKANSYPCQLSGGQQQRVAIARALMLSPEILCFDEPTSALDPELTGEVLKVIRSLKGSDRTMIIVTHEMDFARSVADKVIFVADGIIEEEGSPEQVLVNPKSEKIRTFLSVLDNKN